MKLRYLVVISCTFYALGITSNIISAKRYQHQAISSGDIDSKTSFRFNLLYIDQDLMDAYPLNHMQVVIGIPFYCVIHQDFADAPNLGDSYGVSVLSLFGLYFVLSKEY